MTLVSWCLQLLVIDYYAPFSGKCGKTRAQTVIAAVALAIHEIGDLPRVEAADHHLHRPNIGRLQGKRAQSGTDQRHSLERTSGHLAAQRNLPISVGGAAY